MRIDSKEDKRDKGSTGKPTANQRGHAASLSFAKQSRDTAQIEQLKVATALVDFGKIDRYDAN